MKKLLLSVFCVVSFCFLQSFTKDEDIVGKLEPGARVIYDGEVIYENTSNKLIDIKYCPGAGETCKLTVDVKGVTVTYEEEKGVDKNPIEICVFC